MKIKDGYILRTIAGDNIVLPSGDELDLNVVITLNHSARFLWERLEQGAEADELTEALLGEYEVDRATAEKAVADFIETLKHHDLLA